MVSTKPSSRGARIGRERHRPVLQPVVLSGTNVRVVVAALLRSFLASRLDRKQKAERPSSQVRKWGSRREEVLGVNSGAKQKSRRA